MKSICIIEAATVFVSLFLEAHARVEIPGVDPENYVAKEVPADLAKGGLQKLHDVGVLKYKGEVGIQNERKGNLRALQSMFNDDYYYGDQGAPVGAADLDDDTVVTEEILTVQYFQDNRFSSPDPIYADITSPSREAAGNKWLYANVPLQPIFGINDLPIQGLAQGFCESTGEDGHGFCHFTYEFFELNAGAILVYASLTVEGATQPQGPSILNVLGGTGEFSGAVGEVTLIPVGIDESIIPARIFKDGSFFMGNRNGYDAKMEINVRYLINAPLPIPPPVNPPVPANPIPVTAGFVTNSAASQNILCPGQNESEYCDCDLDCNSGSSRCACTEAQGCCAR
mmetsp:Transcript_25825/g.60552  ORF Transcript_25825/g.60552 Transcript_25825/m.60552 type:complete len:341 (+) Transcript_25825:136-1158(+)|eukprot:CAMPEP_0197182850 /NCGR_PEP_ID=MMETSP1423-20130617/6981_1 /TAXON_ID=476441 /ORGANISM="Pseudo-nitzschia heimii, Strain UNC1101" /LENGTH=340 /DNA_ID=CAMNT_0042633349 /DNA_START=92 /DNA_END=1114 /DNA_ORIENTATION=+